jgi:hypothetical protein
MSIDESGKRFSLVYLTTDQALQDSKRARRRVAWLIDRGKIDKVRLVNQIERELGVEDPSTGHGYLIERFIERCDLRDFLDLISLVRTVLPQEDRLVWIRECIRIFAEEHLRYVINDAGGVRFSADAEFERNVQATIQGLGHSSLKGALTSYEHCLQALSRSPPEVKSAVRSMVEAVEIVFKTLCPGSARIGEAEIKGHLIPKLNSIYTDPTARQAATKLARSLIEWVNGAHFYRHGQVGEEPVEPPFEIATALISEGSSFLRWLAVLHVGALGTAAPILPRP